MRDMLHPRPHAGKFAPGPAVTADSEVGARRAQSWQQIAAFAVLAVLGAVYLAWPVWRAFFPLEIDNNEAWNAYHADAVASGHALYPDPTGLVGNNYPPLSFYVVAALASGHFDALYVGRMLSILATLAIALAVTVLVRQLAASWPAAVLAGLWFLATMARFFAAYVGMNDPHLMALAIMTWALVWLMRRLSAGRAVEPAILLMVVAGFFKHNVAAIPLTAFIWLGYVDRRMAVRAAVFGAGAVAAGLAICGLIWGSAFFAQLLMPRGYDLAHVWGGLGRLQWIAPALVVFVIWVPHDWQNPAARFAAVFVAGAFVLHCVEKLGDGVADNAQFELAVAAAVGLGLAFDRIGAVPAARRWGADRSRLAIVAIMIARLLLSANMVPYRTLASPAFRALIHERAGVALAEAARIRAIPGPVVCSIGLVCRMAGKPLLFDTFLVEQKLRSGRLTRDELDKIVAAGKLRFELVDERALGQFQRGF